MPVRPATRWRVLALVAVALHGPAGAVADPLACQARAALSGIMLPTEVHFTALVAGDDPPISFAWDFGDGASSTSPEPIHTYVSAGAYEAVLTVGSLGGDTCRDTITIPAGVVTDPTCGLTANTTWSLDSSPIRFTAYPALLFDPPPYTWRFRFGDGSTRQVTDPTGFYLAMVEHAYVAPGTYWAAVSLETPLRTHDCYPVQRVTTFVPQVAAVLPAGPSPALRLEPPRPNPFEAAATIAYALPRSGHARLRVLDPNGREVATLVDGVRPAGAHVAVWQGRGGSGAIVPAGLYFALLEHGGERRGVRIVRLP